uniref:Cilia- and flagella-associated protein 58 central coiled coil domain-containing protein n=1 Tax=Globisporangium ultimum (strain ATCC 200006 / CBS 805.95 / DAOM BR144) TaxID=431595 RepID=K3WCH8_GLOUD
MAELLRANTEVCAMSMETDAVAAAASASLIAEMQGVLAHMPDSISLYKTELEKLLTAFTKSQESEQRLLHRTKEILNEIHTSHEAMLRDQEEENETMVQKKKTKLELDAVRQQIAASHQMEADKQQKLNDLRGNLALLQEELSKLSMPGNNANGDIILNEEQELHITSMKRQRAEYARDVEAKSTTLQDLRRETSNLFALLQEEEAKNAQLEENQAKVSSMIQEKQQLTEKEIRRKNALEKELKVHKQTLEHLQFDAATKEALKKEDEENMRKKELLMRESKQKMEKYLKQYDALFRTTHSLTEAMQAQWQKNVELHKENLHVEQELNAKESQLQTITRDAIKIEKLIEIAKEQLLDIDGKRSECDGEREKVKLELEDLMNGAMEAEKRQSELLKKKLDEMLREREVLNKMLVKANDRTQATFDLMKIKENTLKNLQNEINGLKSQVKRQRGQIQQLVGDREKYEREAAQATQKFMTSLEEAKLQDLQVVSLQQKIVESESRLKQQQNLYEAVRTDRNLYSKQLIESQEEIGDMKRKFKIMNHQIEQLKEEITSKDHALVKEHFDHHKVDKEKEILKNELLRIRKQIQSSEQIILNQELEITKLAKIIQEADEEKQRQMKEYGCVVHDRDTLRQQLIQRNEELHVLYEKIKIQRSTLSKGHHQFQEKQKEILQLQERIHSLTFEKEASNNQLQHEHSLKHELFRLEKELLQEKTKIRALSDELDHPLNVHRWRKLEGSDPKRFEMIRKLQALQKKLIKKYEETTIKDLLILEKEKLYVELKTILARQPGAEVAEQLAVYKETLKAKKNQMKQMEDELKMYKMQVQEYRRDQEQLEKEKQRIQQEWIQVQIVRYNDASQFRNNAEYGYGNNAEYSNPED